MANNPGYSMSVDVIGAKELQEAFTKVGDFAKQVFKDAINKTAYDLHKRAFLKAPHKKGGLRDSIHVESEPGHLAIVNGNNVEAIVGTNLEYALAQEKGTVGMTINVKNGRRTANGGRTKPYTYIGNIKPKFYMRDAKNETKTEMADNLRAAMSKIVTHLATKGTSEL